ncbi:MAG TPA: deoxyguanosinetriphosphate triphosphohydrolase, partial [Clostridia bacterium]|nr:deoxyguanosinetriphosphate triphosphohydrolase [Clostridia bacterium]
MKEDYLRFEDEFLSPYAARSQNTRGRQKYIEPCPLRTEYQRDRDRIIHSKAFRRLKHKTQVFLTPGGDHYRTRLTHTLEVTQIARTISRALRLNEDLTEAIALGHDLGHTPFGHAGERVLDKMTGHFTHNEQSLRVVDVLEEDGRGLNLTFEVRDGIINHKWDGNPATLEGKVVSYADRIAYLNHDIDDAIRAGILKEDDIPKEINALLGVKKGQRINAFVVDLVESSYGKPEIIQSPRFGRAMADLREFMFEKVYVKSAAKTEETRAALMLELLYRFYEQ